MQRDMDLIREILLQMVNHDHAYAPKIEIAGRSDEEVGFHVWLLGDAKLIKTTDVTTHGSGSPKAVPVHLTWQGYEFLEAVRNQSTWESAKAQVLSKVGGMSFELLKAYLLFEAKRHLGVG